MREASNTNYCLVVKSDRGPLALVSEEGSLNLPVVVLESVTWLAEQVAELNGQLMERHGLNCTLLRRLENVDDTNLLLMEWHPGSPDPEVDVVWVDPDRVDLPLPPEQLQMVEKWRHSSSDDVVPWEQPGWMKEAVLWLLKHFNGVHHPQLTSLAQIKAGWGMSTLLLVGTTGADYYFKAGTRQGIDEWKLMRLLHQEFPELVPAPLIVEEQRGWMVVCRIDHTDFDPLDYDGLGTAMRAYARIQLGCAHWTNDSRPPGLRVRDASWLRAHVDAFFTTDRVPGEFSALKSQLDPGELARLEKSWRQDIEALETTTLPLTLNQEDLHFDNLLDTGKGPVLIDWADCAMAHPFFSFHRIHSLWGEDLKETERLAREHVTRAYLEVFRHLADDDQLQKEVGITDRLKKLYHAFRWQEMAQDHLTHSWWGKRCRDNAVSNLQVAVNQVAA
jgi:hypothetical protein